MYILIEYYCGCEEFGGHFAGAFTSLLNAMEAKEDLEEAKDREYHSVEVIEVNLNELC